MPTRRKYFEVLAFVAVWMAVGWIFRLDADVYLVIGVPLVVLFQLFIRRQPLRSLWVRDAASFRLGLVGVVIAGVLILAPGYDLVVVRVTEEAMDCFFMASVRLRRCSVCGICAPSTRGKRSSPWFAKFYSSSGHRHRNHGGRRSSQTSLGRVSAPQTGFPAQAVLALLCSLVRTWRR